MGSCNHPRRTWKSNFLFHLPEPGTPVELLLAHSQSLPVLVVPSKPKPVAGALVADLPSANCGAKKTSLYKKNLSMEAVRAPSSRADMLLPGHV